MLKNIKSLNVPARGLFRFSARRLRDLGFTLSRVGRVSAAIDECTLPSKTGWIAINDQDEKTLSDFLIYTAASKTLSLVSDPLDPSEIPDKRLLLGTVTEMGKLQDVGKFFGVANDEIRFLSDLNVPEPSTWVMMLLGFAGLGYAGFRRASKRRLTL
jgi:PEP-CTERM motif